jgi:3-deoxy-D-manno-octulosonate 8-phosphate phosphatase (KDO 8-P phosphatase)
MLHFVLDVDGVMTTGQMLYSSDGKAMKIFGAHDADGLKLIRDRVKIKFITADIRGFDISFTRISRDMGYPLTIVSEADRMEYVSKLGFDNVIFMADGYHDAPVMEKVKLAIAPKNARAEAKRAAHYVTPSKSAEGAVMDACIYLQRML